MVAENKVSADVLAEALKATGTGTEITTNAKAVDGLASEAKAATQAGQRARAFAMDRGVYLLTTLFLGGTLVLIVAGILALELLPVISPQAVPGGKAGEVVRARVPESLIALAATAIGALAGLISPLGVRSTN